MIIFQSYLPSGINRQHMQVHCKFLRILFQFFVLFNLFPLSGDGFSCFRFSQVDFEWKYEIFKLNKETTFSRHLWLSVLSTFHPNDIQSALNLFKFELFLVLLHLDATTNFTDLILFISHRFSQWNCIQMHIISFFTRSIKTTNWFMWIEKDFADWKRNFRIEFMDLSFFLAIASHFSCNDSLRFRFNIKIMFRQNMLNHVFVEKLFLKAPFAFSYRRHLSSWQK